MQMQTPILSTALLLLLAAVAPALAQEVGDAPPGDQASTPADSGEAEAMAAMPSYRGPVLAWKTYEDGRLDDVICRDRIHKAREESGQPPLDREPATEEEPLLIWAVDRREDGCAVLVAKGDPDDIRPIPRVEDGDLLRPAR
jgi:hypothetical protein